MTLRLNDAPVLHSPLDEWPLPTIPAYVESSAQKWLYQDLRRYIEGRVLGRSYLIAGHRGAGKTALVTRVVELLRIRVLQASVREESADLPRGRPFQRPLLVKLHGPSMLGPHPAGDGADALRTQSDQNAAKPPSSGMHAALVQIGAALYRAVAAEVATGFRAHARLPHQPRPDDARELAAQLPLDLDVGVNAAKLRECWLRVGRLRRGVLWPNSADPTLDASRMEDQGLREIAALATASQAFEVCSGRVTYGTTRKDNDAETKTSVTAGSTDVRDTLDKLGTLGVSAIAGASVFGATTDGMTAVGAAALTWLLGTLSISWSRNRTRKDDLTVDYSFIRDRDPATLDRDLPLVITRLREIGLAPVFIIDELDKVPNAAVEIVKLVARLKHLVADFGFFCFLVDRPCFDEFERRAGAAGYPTEHTLFSDRLLLTPEPGPLYRFLLERVVEDTAMDALPARAVFALETMHNARMNLTSVMRRLNHAAEGPNGTIGEVADLLLQRRQIIAVVQIAIGERLRSPALMDRIAVDSGFAQLAVDTLYYPSLAWARGQRVDPSLEELTRYLRRLVQEQGAQSGGATSSAEIRDTDLALLHKALIGLLEDLCDLNKLRKRAFERCLSGDERPPRDDEARLADVIPSEVDSVVVHDDDGHYRFLYDAGGEPIGVRGVRLNTDQITQARSLLDFANSFVETLSKFGITIDELVQTPFLSGLDGASVDAARSGLRVALTLDSSEGDALQHLATLERLRGGVASYAHPLAQLISLVGRVRNLARRPSGALTAIRRLLPLSMPPERWLYGYSEEVEPVPTNADDLPKWREQVMQSVVMGASRTIAEPEDYQRFVNEFRLASLGKPAKLHFRYDDLVMAALDQLPFRALAADMTTMTAQDWSDLALAALPAANGSRATAPYWVLPAMLRALKFGSPALNELVDREAIGELESAGFLMNAPALTSEQCMALAAEFVEGAPERPTGAIVIDTDEEAYGRHAPSEVRPTLLIHATRLADYVPALNWLEANGILTLGADARPVEA